MVIALFVGCANTGAPAAVNAGEAWPDWVAPATDEESSPTVDTEEYPEETPPDQCDPVGCIELAEAVDRGFATLDFEKTGIRVDNSGPYPVCIEDWYTFLSPSSQDAVAGTTGEDEIDPEASYFFPYAQWGVDTSAWWCIEHNQYTATGSEYNFDGERAPARIGNWTNNASDEDVDTLEDHNDRADDGLFQTQHNVWDYLAERSVFVVGREMNWFEVAGRQAVEVTVVVTNIGRVGGDARVSERLPAGWTPSSVSPEASRVESGSDGANTITWNVSLDQAIEPANGEGATRYDVRELHYVLTYSGECSGREIGFSPAVSWVDNDGAAWTSEGSPMGLQCCDSDDSVVGGSGGIGP